MGNIYDISQWQPNTLYHINDIVKNGNFFYYAKLDHTSSSVFEPGNWNGTGSDFNSEIKPLFFWKPSYNSSPKMTPRIKKVQFGNGYVQRLPDGINNNLININLLFELRSTQETTAIAHFLNTRQGTESFLFTPPPPFGKQKRFVCEDWEPNYLFFDNHTIRVVFQEVVI